MISQDSIFSQFIPIGMQPFLPNLVTRNKQCYQNRCLEVHICPNLNVEAIDITVVTNYLSFYINETIAFLTQ